MLDYFQCKAIHIYSEYTKTVKLWKVYYKRYTRIMFLCFFTISNKKIPIVLVIHRAYQQDKTNSHIEKKDFNCRD